MNNVPSNSHQQQLKIGSTSTSPPDTPGTPDTLHKINTNLNSTKQSSKVVVKRKEKSRKANRTFKMMIQLNKNENLVDLI